MDVILFLIAFVVVWWLPAFALMLHAWRLTLDASANDVFVIALGALLGMLVAIPIWLAIRPGADAPSRVLFKRYGGGQ